VDFVAIINIIGSVSSTLSFALQLCAAPKFLAFWDWLNGSEENGNPQIDEEVAMGEVERRTESRDINIEETISLRQQEHITISNPVEAESDNLAILAARGSAVREVREDHVAQQESVSSLESAQITIHIGASNTTYPANTQIDAVIPTLTPNQAASETLTTTEQESTHQETQYHLMNSEALTQHAGRSFSFRAIIGEHFLGEHLRGFSLPQLEAAGSAQHYHFDGYESD
jgi:hypothetical protein